MAFSNYQRQNLIKHHYDLGFIARTQPQGNVKIHSDYIQMGGSYGAFLDVYHYPKSGLKAFWLAPVLNRDNVIGFLSICGQDSKKIRPVIDRSLEELYSRTQQQNLSPTEQWDADTDQQQFLELYNNLRNHAEALKRIYLRLFVYADSLPALRKRIRHIRGDLWDFGMEPFVDEQEYDYRSMYLPLTQQEQLANHRRGQVIESYDLGGSYPFDYVNLSDPGGNYFGYTRTMGAFTFNPYDLRNNRRTRCFSLVAGNTGMGKSTFEKMLCDDAFSRGNYVRNFDVTGEYRSMTEAQNGIIVDTSAKGLHVNMFEIFPTVTNTDGSINQEGSFNQNISKIKTITHIMDSNLKQGDLNLLDDCLTKFYIQRKQWSYNASNNPQKVNILNLRSVQYPTMSEFMEYLTKRKDSINSQVNPDTQELTSIQKLIFAYHNMESRFGYALDGHTNVPYFDSEKVVTFDLSGIKSASAGAENQLFQAVFFSYLSMIASRVIINGKKYRVAKRTIVRHPDGTKGPKFVDDKLGFDVDYYYINIDEAEDYFDVNYPDVVEMIANMMEQMRKNYCAITLAFPTLEDILQDKNNGASSSNWQQYHEATNKIFGLIQYFHFFNLPPDNVAALKDFFRQNQSVTLDQLDTLPNLDKHEVLTVIVGERSYRWRTNPSDNQLFRYR